MNRTFLTPAPALLLGAVALVAGCSNRTNVSAIGNVPGTYSHVYITAQAVWFNSSATAGPDDAGWSKFTLSTPTTVDLIAATNGNFGTLVTDLKLTPTTYSQIRVIPVDPSTPLTTAAQTIGAIYNCEADYIDSQGVTQQLRLELLNPDKGIGVATSLKVPVASIGAAAFLGSASSASSTTGTTTTNGMQTSLFGAPTTTGATGTTTGTTGTTGTTTTTTSSFALSIDAARDLSAFTFGGTNGSNPVTGVLWNQHINAYDLAAAGGIQGTLTLTNLTGISAPSGVPAIEVSAELLSADGSRHYLVASTPVASDGTFTLYPLVANSSNVTDYDVVIHGPGIATIVIKSVQVTPFGSSPVNAGTSTTTNSTTATNTTTGTTTGSTTGSTTGTTTGTSTGTTTNSNLTPPTPTNLVSIGTLIPRAATAYSANIAPPSGQSLPAGAAVSFYQTLPGGGEVPYVIETSPIDPFNQDLAIPQHLSTGTVDSGTYVSSGSTITVTSSAPREGVGTYQVAATAPLYNDGTLGIQVSAPGSGAGSSPPPQQVSIAALSLASGATPATLAASVRPATARKYDQGELLVSNNGQLIATASLNNVLAGGGGTVQLTSLPGGTSSSLFYVSVRAWNSSDPAGTLARQWSDTPVDLRSASSANVEVTVD
jgi:hypothetical protein